MCTAVYYETAIPVMDGSFREQTKLGLIVGHKGCTNNYCRWEGI